MSAVQPVSRCKICLENFTDVDSYNAHIESFTTLDEYAAHVDQRPNAPTTA